MDAELRKRLHGLRNCVQSRILVTNDVERRIGLRALDAFEQLTPGQPPSAQTVGALATAARSCESQVGCTGAVLLNYLAVHHEPAREAIRQLLAEENEHANYWAVSATVLHEKLPDCFVEEILRAALANKHAKVKMSAANTAMQLGLRSLLPYIVETRRNITRRNATTQNTY